MPAGPERYQQCTHIFCVEQRRTAKVLSSLIRAPRRSSPLGLLVAMRPALPLLSYLPHHHVSQRNAMSRKEIDNDVVKRHNRLLRQGSTQVPDKTRVAILARYARLAYLHARLLCDFNRARIRYSQRCRTRHPGSPWDMPVPATLDRDRGLWRRVVQFCLGARI